MTMMSTMMMVMMVMVMMVITPGITHVCTSATGVRLTQGGF